jgi:hypothetical protein
MAIAARKASATTPRWRPGNKSACVSRSSASSASAKSELALRRLQARLE